MREPSLINPNRKDTIQQNTEYLLDANPEGRDASYRIAGSFTFRGPESTSSRQVYGWYATLPR